VHEVKSAARAFPWASLESVSRADVEAARALRRWGLALVRTSDAAHALGELLGTDVAIVPKGTPPRPPPPADDAVGLLLAPAGATDVARGALVEIEAALAATLVARAVRRTAPRVIDGARPAAPKIAGAVGAIALAAARRAHAGVALRVLAAGPAPALARDVAPAGDRLYASFAVMVDEDVYSARISVARDTALLAPEPPWTNTALAAMGDCPLGIPIVASATRSTAGEVGALQRGDAWMPGEWALTRTKAGELTGPVLLAPPGHERAIRADLGEDGRLVLRGDVEELGWAPAQEDSAVTESEKADALVEAVGEVPVVVRVEIGVAEMRAREWASLGRGDVLALGRKVGEPVILRVGGVAVARGELVEIDGEVGVRILGRADTPEVPR
jgi:flagellar motor switch/type III secretory pathway protein FliN